MCSPPSKSSDKTQSLTEFGKYIHPGFSKLLETHHNIKGGSEKSIFKYKNFIWSLNNKH